MARHLWTLTFLALGLPGLAAAEDSFRHGRIRHVEDGVTIQRAAEATADEALPNLPFLPGDRLWTDATGRAEFQFAGGAVLRLDSGTKLDYVAHDDDRSGERVVLRLWSGSLYLHVRERRIPDFDIETPGGLVTTHTRGVYRIDADQGAVRLSVFEGEAVLEGSRKEQVRAGEQVLARRGEIEQGPEPLERTSDAFASWVDERQDRLVFASDRPAYLPQEVSYYADEFDSHGSWYYESEVGHVWRPYVGAGWRPYVNGRWVWTVYGWTWVAHEPWGWAPFHYGRWGFSPVIGWYWIPGRSWGPAWVSWAVGSDYVGWCPLGYRDRPVFIHERRPRGHAVPRGTTRADTAAPAAPAYVYARRKDLLSGGGVLRSFAKPEKPAEELQVVERTRVGKDFGVFEAAATPRSGRTKPTMGDTVPELRADPAVMPFRASPWRKDVERYQRDSFGEAAVESGKRTPRGVVRESEASSRGDTPARDVTPARDAPSPGVPAMGVARRGRDKSAGEATAQPAQPPARDTQEREVMRPIFEGLSRPRGMGKEERSGGSEERSRGGAVERNQGERNRFEKPRSEAPPRHETPAVAAPRQQAPPPPPPPPVQGVKSAGEAERRRKDKDQ